MNKRETYPGAQTVSRAVALLTAFTDAQPERSLTGLARAVGLNRTTTYRLLRALESDGLVMRGASGDSYRLGPEVIVLGARALRSNDLHSAGHAELETLAHATGETATLEVLAGDQVLILDEVIVQQHLLGAAQFAGTRWPAHATSTGKVLLAHLSDADRKALLHAPLTKHTPNTITTLAALRAELAGVREQGYATAVDELELGFTAVGAPVRNHDGVVVAAISLGGPSVRIAPDRIPKIAARVSAAAERISERLGFRAE